MSEKQAPPPSVPSITYIELRQIDSNSVNQNGDYTINLEQPVLMREGDSLSLYKAFIDTRDQQDNNIIIDNDLNIHVDFVPYIQNWSANQQLEDEPDPIMISVGGTAPVDNKPYFLAFSDEHPDPAGGAILTEIFLGVNDHNKIPSGFSTEYQYSDIYGETQFLTHNFGLPVTEIPLVYVIQNLNIRCIKDSFSDITSDQTYADAFKIEVKHVKKNVKTQFKYTNAPAPSTPTTKHLEPFTSRKTVVLPAGKYTPNGIAENISLKMTEFIEPFSGAIPVQIGNILVSSGLVGVTETFSSSQGVCVDCETGNKILLPFNRKGDLNNYLIGASQFALEFDSDSNLFSLEFIHTPFFIGDTGQTKTTGVGFVFLDNDTTSIVNKFGGILLTNLTATRVADNETIDFWGKTLGFNVPNMCVSFEAVPETTINDVQPDGTTLVVTYTSTKVTQVVQDGVNTTGNLTSIDVTVDKTSDRPFQFTSLAPNKLIVLQPTAVNNTISIPAVSPFGTQIESIAPYYKVELASNFLTNTIGESMLMKNIIGIIGRYYQSGTYSLGTSADSYAYVHKGLPQLLNSFKVRILDNFDNQPILGDENSIYIQVINN